MGNNPRLPTFRGPRIAERDAAVVGSMICKLDRGLFGRHIGYLSLYPFGKRGLKNALPAVMYRPRAVAWLFAFHETSPLKR
jgi:hypothetical protein